MRARLTELAQRTPLRVKLVVALLVLVAIALAATGVATAAALRSYLTDRVDTQLASSASTVTGIVERRLPLRQGGEGMLELPGQMYVQLNDAGGVRTDQRFVGTSGARPPAIPAIDQDEAERRAGQPFSVSAPDGHHWRAVVVPLSGGRQSLVVALGADDVDSTVRRLVRTELGIGLVVLGLLGTVGYLVVRSSLRPLEEVEQTAAAIAAGDLSRRVPERDPGTEVGRLSRALNGMLAQIEAAFRARESSEQAARASEDRMRRFVADASHELRTPLTSIRGFAELYRQGAVPEPDDVARVMRKVEDEAARMGLLVDDLLLLARLDQQRPLERVPVDLLAIAADVVHDAAALAPDRSVELRVEDDGGAAVVLGDEARLRQVVANLVSNAVSHTPAETSVSVTVTTVTSASDPDGGLATLEVSDHGPGLTPEDAARVFERFYRADPSRTRAAGGTGLGLSIVAALVAAHGGAVSVDTRPGRGATFRVALPRCASAAEPAPAGSRVPSQT